LEWAADTIAFHGDAAEAPQLADALRPGLEAGDDYRHSSSACVVASTAETASDLDPSDFLDVGALLSDEELLIRNTVRAFVAGRVMPRIERWFEDGVFPIEMTRELGALGLFGMQLQGYGCACASAVSYGLACMELEAGDSGFRSFVSVQASLAMFPIWNYGSVTSALILDDCVLSGHAVLPNVTGLKGPLSCLNEARFGIVWGALGAGRACYMSALEYAGSRAQFGKPTASFQLTSASWQRC
jgi:alkylation response protein AidB-like acyl-CoA dehydrogenase